MSSDEWTDCPKCGARLKASNLDEHMEDVHPKGVTSDEDRERLRRRRERLEKGKKYGAVAAAIIVVVGGFAAASQLGLLDTGPAAVGVSCENVAEGQGETVHEHPTWGLYLNNSEPFVPYDFTQRRYQGGASYIHLEGRSTNPVHVHEARPSLGCFLQTLGWSVQREPRQMTSDTGVTYPDNATHDLLIRVDGEPAEDGWATALAGGNEYTIRWTYSPGNTTAS